MRIGLVGPAGNSLPLLEEAARLLISDIEADRVVYLAGDTAIEAFIAEADHREPRIDPHDRIAETAIHGDSGEIRALLQTLRRNRYLDKMGLVPPPPARAIDMIGDRIVLIVHDKRVVDEEDVLNADIVVYGSAPSLTFKRFGPKCFFSPGPLADGCVGLLEDQPDSGSVRLKALNLAGDVMWSEPIQGRVAKVMVAP